MTSLRAVFLDYDGTLADRGVVPISHRQAVREARATAKVVLCTGRCRPMLGPEILGIGFDGIVGSSGAYVELDGKVLADRRIPDELAARALAVFEQNRVASVIESPEVVLGPVGVIDRMRERMLRGGVDPERIIPGLAVQEREDLRGVSFAKVSCFNSPVPIGQLAAQIGPGLATVESSLPGDAHDGGEIFRADVHKSDGARLVAAELGIDRSQILAVGDGANDIDLVDYAGTGVAIEGSDPRLVAVSQRLAPKPAEHGLTTLFTELGLIGEESTEDSEQARQAD